MWNHLMGRLLVVLRYWMVNGLGVLLERNGITWNWLKVLLLNILVTN